MHENRFIVRPAEFEDAEAIFNLIKQFPEEVLPRSLSDIVQNIDRFLVCETIGKVVGTVSWQILPSIGAPRAPSVEIMSLAVSEDFSRQGMGRALVQGVIERMTKLHPAQIVALTFHPQFFEKMGFREVAKETLMHKLYTGCINCTKYDSPFTCPEIAVVLEVNDEAEVK